MKTLTRILIVILILSITLSCWAKADTKKVKNRKTVVMIIPDPKAPSNAETMESTGVNTAYNEITSVLLSKNITVIDKAYVDEALQEIRLNKDIDMDAASIQYGKKNMADKVLWFYVIDKSANYQDFHFETRMKLISVRTGQVVLSVQKEGVDKENKEAAIQKSVQNTLTEAIPQIATSSEMFTVTFKGRIKLEVQNELDNLFDSIDEVDTYDGYVVSTNAYEYRVSGNITVSELRNAIHERIQKKRIEIELDNQTVNSLVFRMIPKGTVHSSLAWVSGLATLASAGASGYFYMQGADSFDQYKNARTLSESASYKDDTKSYDQKTMICGITTGVMASWFVFEVMKVNKLKKVDIISLYKPDNKTIGLAFNVRF